MPGREPMGEGPLDTAHVLEEEAKVVRAADDGAPLSALCISGGGIRSATFGLGVLQGLARVGLLSRFHYLSTVSGGGYIGSWLTAWIRRSTGVDEVTEALAGRAADLERPEAPAVKYLREYNNYMSPRLGWFSLDAWTLVATLARNVLMNWLVFIPLLMAALLVPRLILAIYSFPELLYGDLIFALPEADYTVAELNTISGTVWMQWVVPVASALFYATALFNILQYLPGVGETEHSTGDVVFRVLIPLGAATFLFLAFDSLYYLGDYYTPESNALELVKKMGWATAVAFLAFLAFETRGSPGRAARLLFSPLTLAIACMSLGTAAAAWVAFNFILWDADQVVDLTWSEYVTYAPLTTAVGFGLGTVIFVGLTSRGLHDRAREWMARCVGALLMIAGSWTLLAFAVLILPGWITQGHWLTGAGVFGTGSLGAALTVLGGRVAGSGEGSTLRGRATALALKVAPAVFVLALIVALGVLTNLLLTVGGDVLGRPLVDLAGQPVSWRSHEDVLTRVDVALLVLAMVMLVAVSLIVGWFVNINTFSLHGLYRDRLTRAYLGASHPRRREKDFTGFAEDDDLPVHQEHPVRPLHVLNLTLNLVGGERLDWQQRKAEAFTVSPLHCGCARLGYRPSARYGGRRGMTLGTALAISGAAASPSMGHYSNPLVGFIMTLFNARLGVWMGNPGRAGAKSWTHASPHSAVVPMVKEALGLTSDDEAYVYLSDGGHFDNLGVYEMVRRGCRTLVVLDAGADPNHEFDGLGNTIRKIRIDLGIPIHFDNQAFERLRSGETRACVGVIGYSRIEEGVEDGRILYIKPVRLGREPADVESYAAQHPAFPHESTGDQFFDESQTESYRVLGLQTVRDLAADGSWETLEDFVDQVARSTDPVEGGSAQAPPSSRSSSPLARRSSAI